MLTTNCSFATERLLTDDQETVLRHLNEKPTSSSSHTSITLTSCLNHQQQRHFNHPPHPPARFTFARLQTTPQHLPPPPLPPTIPTSSPVPTPNNLTVPAAAAVVVVAARPSKTATLWAAGRHVRPPTAPTSCPNRISGSNPWQKIPSSTREEGPSDASSVTSSCTCLYSPALAMTDNALLRPLIPPQAAAPSTAAGSSELLLQQQPQQQFPCPPWQWWPWGRGRMQQQDQGPVAAGGAGGRGRSTSGWRGGWAGGCGLVDGSGDGVWGVSYLAAAAAGWGGRGGGIDRSAEVNSSEQPSGSGSGGKGGGSSGGGRTMLLASLTNSLAAAAGAAAAAGGGGAASGGRSRTEASGQGGGGGSSGSSRGAAVGGALRGFHLPQLSIMETPGPPAFLEDQLLAEQLLRYHTAKHGGLPRSCPCCHSSEFMVAKTAVADTSSNGTSATATGGSSSGNGGPLLPSSAAGSGAGAGGGDAGGGVVEWNSRPLLCDTCGAWVHLGCAGVQRVEQLPPRPWFHCRKCRDTYLRLEAAAQANPHPSSASPAHSLYLLTPADTTAPRARARGPIWAVRPLLAKGFNADAIAGFGEPAREYDGGKYSAVLSYDGKPMSAATFNVWGSDAQLCLLATAGAQRGQGNGTALVADLEATLSRLGVSRLLVQARGVALPLWLDRLGYRLVNPEEMGGLHARLPLAYYDCPVMEKWLGTEGKRGAGEEGQGGELGK